MPSAKHERLYGASVQKEQKKKQGEPLTPGQTEEVVDAVPEFAVEGGLVNDASGEATKRAKASGYRSP